MRASKLAVPPSSLCSAAVTLSCNTRCCFSAFFHCRLISTDSSPILYVIYSFIVCIWPSILMRRSSISPCRNSNISWWPLLHDLISFLCQL